jgi:hypothetical protein
MNGKVIPEKNIDFNQLYPSIVAITGRRVKLIPLKIFLNGCFFQ